jgi:hypothetical protein
MARAYVVLTRLGIISGTANILAIDHVDLVTRVPKVLSGSTATRQGSTVFTDGGFGRIQQTYAYAYELLKVEPIQAQHFQD